MSNFFFTFQQMIDTSLENAPHQILLYKGQDVCVFFIEVQTFGRIGM